MCRQLLRLLQENIYYPLGSDHPKQCHARIVTAANKDLTMLAGQDGEFRMDLYYRLSTHLIRIPPLRERREDIPVLVNFLAAKAAAAMRKKTPVVSDQAMALLLNHPFWGNIRELKAYIVDAVARCEHSLITDNLIAERLTGRVAGKTGAAADTTSLTALFGHFPTLDELMEYAVNEALATAENNQSQASRLLGISRQALHKRLKKKRS